MKISIISFRISSNIPSKIRPCGKERISAAYFDYDDVTEWIWFTIESFNCLNTFLLFFLLKGSILFIMSGGRWETFCVTIIFLSLFSSVDGLFFVFLFFFFFLTRKALAFCRLLCLSAIYSQRDRLFAIWLSVMVTLQSSLVMRIKNCSKSGEWLENKVCPLMAESSSLLTLTS